ncbi:MAG: type II toxin-antitoxin system HicB family antitoxin [Verrucomicrobia bacterium]|nr:type II toxin-antitoxin system HicB family antitoxin [Verrucomicrobiota bacterium]
MKVQTYHAVFRKDDGWWIGWVEEIPGVNSQGKTKTELLKNLSSTLREALEMNREDAGALA